MSGVVLDNVVKRYGAVQVVHDVCLTVEPQEFVVLVLRIRKASKSEIASSVEEVAGILGLTEYLDRRPADLSGGQRQRVAMGRAIVRHPKVFLFDEPLSNLDAKLRTQMRAEIKRLHNRLGVTSIYVTHDQVEAMTLADRIVVMHDGRIEQVGSWQAASEKKSPSVFDLSMSR